MTVICEDDVIASVADALQYISYYHSADFIRAMGRAYAAEQSPAARDAIAQILTNSRMCAEGHRPLNPSDSVADWVLEMVPEMGAGWCPPGMLGIGIGGSAEKAMLLAKKSLMEPIDITELIARGAKSKLEELRLEIYRRANALGIGAQGLGGLTTVLDVKVLDYPTHAASLPVAVIPNCAARVVAFVELGMEAVYEFEVQDTPVTVAVSSDGESVHDTGPLAWRGKFAGIPVAVE